jgi:hypothetical protein
MPPAYADDTGRRETESQNTWGSALLDAAVEPANRPMSSSPVGLLERPRSPHTPKTKTGEPKRPEMPFYRTFGT